MGKTAYPEHIIEWIAEMGQNLLRIKPEKYVGLGKSSIDEANF